MVSIRFLLLSLLMGTSFSAEVSVLPAPKVEEPADKDIPKAQPISLTREASGKIILDGQSLSTLPPYLEFFVEDKKVAKLVHYQGQIFFHSLTEDEFIIQNLPDVRVLSVKSKGNVTFADPVKVSQEALFASDATVTFQQGIQPLEDSHVVLGGKIVFQGTSSLGMVSVIPADLTIEGRASVSIKTLLAKSQHPILQSSLLNKGDLIIESVKGELRQIHTGVHSKTQLGTANISCPDFLNGGDLSGKFMNLKGRFQNQTSGKMTVQELFTGDFHRFIDDGKTNIRGVAAIRAESARFSKDFKAHSGQIHVVDSPEITPNAHFTVGHHFSLSTDGDLGTKGDFKANFDPNNDVDTTKFLPQTKRLLTGMRAGITFSAKGSILHKGRAKSTNSSITFDARNKVTNERGVIESGLFKDNNTQIKGAIVELLGREQSHDKMTVQAKDVLLNGERSVLGDLIIQAEGSVIQAEGDRTTFGISHVMGHDLTLDGYFEAKERSLLKAVTQVELGTTSRLVGGVHFVHGTDVHFQGTIDDAKALQAIGEASVTFATGSKTTVDDSTVIQTKKLSQAGRLAGGETLAIQSETTTFETGSDTKAGKALVRGDAITHKDGSKLSTTDDLVEQATQTIRHEQGSEVQTHGTALSGSVLDLSGKMESTTNTHLHATTKASINESASIRSANTTTVAVDRAETTLWTPFAHLKSLFTPSLVLKGNMHARNHIFDVKGSILDYGSHLVSDETLMLDSDATWRFGGSWSAKSAVFNSDLFMLQAYSSLWAQDVEINTMTNMAVASSVTGVKSLTINGGLANLNCLTFNQSTSYTSNSLLNASEATLFTGLPMTYALPIFEKDSWWDTSKPWYKRELISSTANLVTTLGAQAGIAVISPALKAYRLGSGVLSTLTAGSQFLTSWDSERTFRPSQWSKKMGQGLQTACAAYSTYQSLTAAYGQEKADQKAPDQEKTETTKPEVQQTQDTSSSDLPRPVSLWDRSISTAKTGWDITKHLFGPTATVNCLWDLESSRTGYFFSTNKTCLWADDRSVHAGVTSNTTAYSGSRTGHDFTFGSTVTAGSDFTVGGKKYIAGDYLVKTGGTLHQQSTLDVHTTGDASFISDGGFTSAAGAAVDAGGKALVYSKGSAVHGGQMRGAKSASLISVEGTATAQSGSTVIASSGDATVSGGKGAVTERNSTVTSQTGQAAVVSAHGDTTHAGTVSGATGSVVQAVEGIATAQKGSTVIASNGDATVSGDKGAVTEQNASVTSQTGQAAVVSAHGDATHAGNLSGATGSVVQAVEGIATAQKGSTVTASNGDATVSGDKGAVTEQNASVTSQTGQAAVVSAHGDAIHAGTVSGATGAFVQAVEGTAKAQAGSSVIASNGDATVSGGKGAVTEQGATVNGVTAAVTSSNGNVVHGGTAHAKKEINISGGHVLLESISQSSAEAGGAVFVHGRDHVATQSGATTQALADKSDDPLNGRVQITSDGGMTLGHQAEGKVVIAESQGQMAVQSSFQATTESGSLITHGGIVAEEGSSMTGKHLHVENTNENAPEQIEMTLNITEGGTTKVKLASTQTPSLGIKVTDGGKDGTYFLETASTPTFLPGYSTNVGNACYNVPGLQNIPDFMTQTGMYQNFRTRNQLFVETTGHVLFSESLTSASRTFSLVTDTFELGNHVHLDAPDIIGLHASNGNGVFGYDSRVKAGLFYDIGASGDVLMAHRLQTRNWDTEHTEKYVKYTKFETVEFEGGQGIAYTYTDPETGEESVRYMGGRIQAGGEIKGMAFRNKAGGDIILDGKKGIENDGTSILYLDDYDKDKGITRTKRTYRFNTKFFTGETISENGKVIVLSKKGHFTQVAGKLYAREGVDNYTRDDIHTPYLKGQAGKKTTRSTSGLQVVTSPFQKGNKQRIEGLASTYQEAVQYGPVRHVSAEGWVRMPGLQLSAPNSRVKIYGAKGRYFDCPILENSLKTVENKWSLRGVNPREWIPSIGSGYHAVGNLADGKIAQGAGNLCPLIGVGYDRITNRQHWQSKGPGFIDAGSWDGGGGPVYQMNGFDIKIRGNCHEDTSAWYVSGARLNYSSNTTTLGCTFGMRGSNPTGEVHASHSQTRGRTYQTGHLTIGGEFTGRIGEMDIDQAVVQINTNSGEIGSVNVRTRQNKSETNSVHASVDTNGMVSVGGTVAPIQTRVNPTEKAGLHIQTNTENGSVGPVHCIGGEFEVENQNGTVGPVTHQELPREKKAEGLSLGISFNLNDIAGGQDQAQAAQASDAQPNPRQLYESVADVTVTVHDNFDSTTISVPIVTQVHWDNVAKAPGQFVQDLETIGTKIRDTVCPLPAQPLVPAIPTCPAESPVVVAEEIMTPAPLPVAPESPQADGTISAGEDSPSPLFALPSVEELTEHNLRQLNPFMHALEEALPASTLHSLDHSVHALHGSPLPLSTCYSADHFARTFHEGPLQTPDFPSLERLNNPLVHDGHFFGHRLEGTNWYLQDPSLFKQAQNTRFDLMSNPSPYARTSWNALNDRGTAILFYEGGTLPTGDIGRCHFNQNYKGFFVDGPAGSQTLNGTFVQTASNPLEAGTSISGIVGHEGQHLSIRQRTGRSYDPCFVPGNSDLSTLNVRNLWDAYAADYSLLKNRGLLHSEEVRFVFYGPFEYFQNTFKNNLGITKFDPIHQDILRATCGNILEGHSPSIEFNSGKRFGDPFSLSLIKAEEKLRIEIPTFMAEVDMKRPGAAADLFPNTHNVLQGLQKPTEEIPLFSLDRKVPWMNKVAPWLNRALPVLDYGLNFYEQTSLYPDQSLGTSAAKSGVIMGLDTANYGAAFGALEVMGGGPAVWVGTAVVVGANCIPEYDEYRAVELDRIHAQQLFTHLGDPDSPVGLPPSWAWKAGDAIREVVNAPHEAAKVVADYYYEGYEIPPYVQELDWAHNQRVSDNLGDPDFVPSLPPSTLHFIGHGIKKTAVDAADSMLRGLEDFLQSE